MQFDGKSWRLTMIDPTLCHAPGSGVNYRAMSPTVFRAKGFRFFFFSREERRMHVHVHGENGEAKFWLEPNIELAQNYGLSQPELNDVLRLIGEREDVIRRAWHDHFGS
jgi:hypothetical protein